MSGGVNEYVMGNYYDVKGSSGFTSMPDSKYYDKYTTTSVLTACNGGVCYGHGLSETSGWYGDSKNFVSGGYPWFSRGGISISSANDGAFYMGAINGSAAASHGFRSVMVNAG